MGRRLADDDIRCRGVRSRPIDTLVAGHVPVERPPPKRNNLTTPYAPPMSGGHGANVVPFHVHDSIGANTELTIWSAWNSIDSSSPSWVLPATSPVTFASRDHVGTPLLAGTGSGAAG